VRRDSAGALAAVAISVDQGGSRVPTTIAVRGDTLVATMAGAGASYTGVIAASGDSLRGTFTQGGRSLPLGLARVPAVAAATIERPQDPRPPFPYRAVDVTFPGGAGVTIAGTLTIPAGAGPFPAVVLVSGSGPQDRDGSLMGHRPFAVIADHLARRGIATLRYDERGVGRSSGTFGTATSADFADDAEGAVRFARGRAEIARDRVGIVGHSEGALIAPMVAARPRPSPGRDVAFVVLLAGPGLRGDSILALQNRLIQSASGVPAPTIDRAVATNARLFAAVTSARDSADAAARLAAVRREVVAAAPEGERAAVDAALAQATPALLGAWMRHFLAYDPRPALRRVRVPVLALNGTLDLQVPHAVNLAAIDSALAAGGNRDRTTRALPGLNHLFQTARTGLPDEYAQIAETFAPAALDAIASWVAERFAR
jgi:hypothetical protein